jgi:adenine-specific DNA glycosylase
MDLGATICKPRTPLSPACPIAAWCRYAAHPPGAPAAPAPDERAPASRAAATVPAFSATTRWLRGRILDRLRAAVDPAWTRLDEPIGVHDTNAVAAALAGLAADGLIEPADRCRARLATS